MKKVRKQAPAATQARPSPKDEALRKAASEIADRYISRTGKQLIYCSPPSRSAA
jgi:hypothetical protein